MRNFWALPAVLRLALAAHVPFSVQQDLLAFPQFEIIYSETFIPEADAKAILRQQAQKQSTIPVNDSERHEVQTQDHMHEDNDSRPENKDTYEHIMFEDLPYLCTIPYVAPIESETVTKSPDEQQKELMRASDHGRELLQGMKEQSCLFYPAGWWVYSFCYNQDIRQFHPLPAGRGGVPVFPPQEDPTIQSYVLGRFEEPVKDATSASTQSEPSVSSTPSDTPVEATTKEVSASPTLQTRGETNFLVQELGGGTRCDLTGKPRRVEVQFHCNPQRTDHISMMKETASCVYQMVIHTPRLCNDVAFLPQQIDKPNPITCREIVSEDGVDEWRSWKAQVAQKTLFDVEQRTQLPPLASNGQPIPPPLIIGGIEVGAQKLVGGTPERTIKPSKIISNAAKQGKNDKFLATLARSDGKKVTVMSDDDMDKVGLKAAKEEAERYRNRLKDNAASGVPWKLELWRTDEGEEFRMFVGMDANELADDDRSQETVLYDESEVASKNKEKPKTEAGEEGSQEEYKKPDPPYP